MLLVLIALASVPVMLLPKPLILKERHKKRAAQLEAYGRVLPTDADSHVFSVCTGLTAPLLCILQVLLVLIALASVPVMLLPKPLILKERSTLR